MIKVTMRKGTAFVVKDQSGLVAFMGWERLAQALAQSSELHLRDNEFIEGIQIEDDGLTIVIGQKGSKT